MIRVNAIFILIVVFASCLAGAASRLNDGTTPDDWVLRAPQGAMIGTDTMPQGAAASPDRTTLAVLCSGFNQPTLRLYSAGDLNQLASIPLPGAFGRPVWIDDQSIAIAGANADAVLVVDVVHQRVRAIPLGKGSYPTAIARWHDTFALATDRDFSVRVGALDDIANAKPVKIGGHVGGLAFTADGKTLFASNRSASSFVAIDTHSLRSITVATGLHPSDLLVWAGVLYVAETDSDSVGRYDTASLRNRGAIFVGDSSGAARLAGVSPNALSSLGDTIFVSLGAANSVAVLRGGRLRGRIPGGWYPTDVVPIGSRLFIVNGKGEGSQPNPYFKSQIAKSFYEYIASIEYGSIRVYRLSPTPYLGNPQGARGWAAARVDPIIRKDGPIRHVFFVLKENRSYDQVLGDMRQGNGDAKLAWFGARVTPNEHALAQRFGLFDNTYTSGEVSESGHDWSDAAFVNDYVQRTWPINYAFRGNDDASFPGIRAVVPRNGYIWQDAFASHVTFRDYGEVTNIPDLGIETLRGHYDKHFMGFDLHYSDVDRVREWRREFEAFVRKGDLPQLEYIWLPNDHTGGSRPGLLTPAAYIAQNDYATGLLVDAISHSSVWGSSAIFIIEDDSQDGPDHVSDQRTTMFVASPYARGGLEHAHYSTVSVLRTMEILLGLPPLSTYDAMAVPLDAAFSSSPRLAPYIALPPRISITAKNGKLAYGAALSLKLNFARPDATMPGVLRNIIAHNHHI